MALKKAGLQYVSEGFDGFLRDVGRASSALTSFGGSADTVGRKVSSFGNIAIGAFREMGAMATRAAVDLGLAASRMAIDLGGQALTSAMDLQDSMAMLGATSGATGGQLDTLKQRARELGADLTLPATSAADAGKAMLELSKAGLSVDQVLAASRGTLQLAAAANISEAEAAEIAANALNSFKLSGERASFVSDLLANASNKSSIEITDAAASFKMASAVFSAFQGPAVGAEKAMIDMTAAIALLGNAGIKGSDAGTALKQMLLSLTGPSDKSKTLMIELAKSIGVGGDIAFTSAGKMRPLKEILDLVAKSTKNMTEEERAKAITQIFGADASRAVIALMQAGPAALDDMTAAITRQGGAAELAAARSSGLRGALDGFKSTLETIGLVLAEPFLEPLEKAFRQLGEALGKLPIDKWANTTAQALTRFAKRIQTGTFADIVPYLLKVGRDLGRAALQWVAEAIPQAVTKLLAFRNKVVESILAGLPTLITSFGEWGREVGAWVTRAGPIMLANFTQSTVDLINLIGKHLPGIIDALGKWGSEFASWVIRAMPGLLAALGTMVKALLVAIAANIPGIIAALAVWGGKLVDWVTTASPKMFVALNTLGSTLLTWIAARAPEILTKLATWGATLSAWVTAAAPGAMGKILDYRNQVVAFVLTNAPLILNTLGAWGTQLGAWIVKAAPVMLSTFTAKTVDLINLIGAHLPAIITTLGKWGLALINWIVTNAPGMLSALGTAVGQLLDAIGRNLPGIVAALAAWGAKFVQWVIDASPKLFAQLLVMNAALIKWIADRLPGIVAQLATWAGQFVAWMIPVAGKLLVAAGEMFAKLIAWIIQKAPSLPPVLLGWATKFGDWVTFSAIPAMITALGGLGSSLITWLQTKATDIAKEGSVGRAIVDGIKNGIASMWTSMTTAISYFYTTYIASPLIALVGGAIEYGKTFVANVRAGIEFYAVTMKTFVTTFFNDNVFSPVTNFVNSAYGNAQTIIARMQEGFSSMSSTISTFTTRFFNDNVVGPINGLIASTGVYDKARAIIEQIRAGFESYAVDIKTFTTNFFNNNVVGPITAIAGAGAKIGKDLVISLWNGMNDNWATELTGKLAGIVTGIPTQIADLLNSGAWVAGEWIQPLYAAGRSIVRWLWEGVKSSWNLDFLNKIIAIIPTIPNEIMKALGADVWSGNEYIVPIVQAGKDIVLGLWKGISNNWTGGVLDKLVDIVKQIPTKIREILTGEVSIGGELIAPVVHAGKLIVLGLWKGIYDNWTGGVLNKIKGIIDMIPEKITEIIDAVKYLGGEYITPIVNVGKQIVEGIWKGVNDNWSKLTTRIAEVVAGLPEWFKKLLGITSPSTVAAQEIGKPFAEGIGVGFLDGMVGVRDMMSKSLAALAAPQFVTPIVSTAQLQMQSAGGSNTSNTRNYNYSPTYGATPPSPMQDFAVMRAFNV